MKPLLQLLTFLTLAFLAHWVDAAEPKAVGGASPQVQQGTQGTTPATEQINDMVKEVAEVRRDLALVASLQSNAFDVLIAVTCLVATLAVVIASYGWYSVHTLYDRDKQRLLQQVEERVDSLFNQERDRLEKALSDVETLQTSVRSLAGEVAATLVQTQFRTDEWPEELVPPTVERQHQVAMKIRTILSGAGFTDAEIGKTLEPWIAVLLNGLVRHIYYTIHDEVVPTLRRATTEELQRAREIKSANVDFLDKETDRLERLAADYRPHRSVATPRSIPEAVSQLLDLQGRLFSEDREVGAKMAPVIAGWISRLGKVDGLGHLPEPAEWYKLRYHS